MINSKVYSEVYATIFALGDEYVDKTPIDVMDFFDEERDEDYLPEIDQNKALNEQGLEEDTVTIIAMLKLNYWCETEEEKAEFLAFLKTNEATLQEKLMASGSTRELLRLFKRA